MNLKIAHKFLREFTYKNVYRSDWRTYMGLHDDNNQAMVRMYSSELLSLLGKEFVNAKVKTEDVLVQKEIKVTTLYNGKHVKAKPANADECKTFGLEYVESDYIRYVLLKDRLGRVRCVKAVDVTNEVVRVHCEGLTAAFKSSLNYNVWSDSLDISWLAEMPENDFEVTRYDPNSFRNKLKERGAGLYEASKFVFNIIWVTLMVCWIAEFLLSIIT